MEKDKVNSKSKLRAILILLGILAFSMFLTSILLHVKPSLMADSIINFSTHHYFLIGFISLTMVLVCYKFYESVSEKIEKVHQLRKKRGITRAQMINEGFLEVKEKIYHNAHKLVSQQIDKQKVKELSFDNNDVLKSEEEKIRRQDNLAKAMMLGNAIKHKVRIYFRDKESNKHIETTVWHASSSHISLKGGIVLPVKSIYKVEI